MSITAYQRSAAAAETPRQTERRALEVATARLRAARDEALQGVALIEALHFNQELWRLFADDCLASGNGLPTELRAAIVSLALWVGRHSSDVAAGREGIEPLIEVNRMIAEGLGQR